MRVTLPREYYLPKQELNATKLESKASDACVYTWTEERNGKTVHLAKGFAGKSNKPKFFYRYPTIALRDADVAKFLAACDEQAKAKANRQAKLKAEKAALDCRVDLPIGTVMVSSWGWEQTNVDFFKVTAHLSRTKFVVQPISKTMTSGVSSMSAMVMPDPSSEHGEPMTVTLSAKDRFVRPDLQSNQWAHKHDGRPMYCSWYG